VFLGFKAKRQPEVVGVRKLMESNSTRIAATLLCRPEKNFFQFVSTSQSVARYRQNEAIDKLNFFLNGEIKWI
jgi:hypothetical protein